MPRPRISRANGVFTGGAAGGAEPGAAGGDPLCPGISGIAVGAAGIPDRQDLISRISRFSGIFETSAPGGIFHIVRKLGRDHGAGVGSDDGGFGENVRQLAENGQIATQYVDLSGNVTMDSQFNPNGSTCAVEGITSPDGRVLGKMGHAERIGKYLYRNVPGDYDMGLFRSAVKYFK